MLGIGRVWFFASRHSEDFPDTFFLQEFAGQVFGVKKLMSREPIHNICFRGCLGLEKTVPRFKGYPYLVVLELAVIRRVAN